MHEPETNTPADGQHYLYRPQAFVGTLSIEDARIPISFSLSANLSGCLLFDVEPLPTTKDTLNLAFYHGKPGARVKEFGLVAESADGWTLQSDRMSLGNTERKGSQPDRTITIGLRAQKATLRQARTPRDGKEALFFLVKGLECFGFPSLSHALGTVSVGGGMNLKNVDQANGLIGVTRDLSDDRPSNWRTDAEDLLRHVNHVLGFARGAPLRVPVVKHYGQNYIDVVFYSTTEGCKAFLAPCSELNLERIVAAAVSSFDSIGKRKNALDLAIGWFIVPTAYDAIRYLSCMTALESLVAEDLGGLKTSVLNPNRFRSLRRKLDAGINDESDLSNDEKETLKEKLGALNRVALRAKLERCAADWGVYLGDFPSNFLRELLNVRDDLVHRGEWKEDGDMDIWDHLLPLRELITRFILAGLGFQGGYQCYLEGGSMKQFPIVTLPQSPSDLNDTVPNST